MLDEPQNVKNNADDPLAKRLVEVIERNHSAYEKHREEIRKIKELDREAFVVDTPSGTRRLPSGLIRQISEKIVSKMQRPSSSYHSEGVDEKVAGIVRDGVKTVQEEGGYSECLKTKPSAFRDMIMFGNAIVKVGIDEKALDKFPVRYDNVDLDKVWVDKNARLMRSKRDSRQVTRIVIIETYDYDQAVSIFPDAKFGKGRIPRSTDSTDDFYDLREDQDNNNEVEIAHFFDIGGDKPVHAIFAGAKMTRLRKLEGTPKDDDDVDELKKRYPYFWKKTGRPYIPIDVLRCFESVEGFWDYGVGHAFYKYAVARRQLLNKVLNQNLQAMSDLTILNAKKGEGQTVVQQIRNAQQMVANGDKGIIINDTGEPIQVGKMEAQQFEQAVAVLYDQLDRDIKRWGINIDAIREAQSTTATQIIQEQEVEDEFVQERLNINTNFFQFMEEATMNFIEMFVSPDNDMPIRTTETRKTGRQNALGLPVEEPVSGITLGDVSEEIRNKTFFVEVSTKSGIRQKDSTLAARSIAIARLAAGNPTVASKAISDFADAVSFKLPDAPPPQQGDVQQKGAEAAAEQITGEDKELSLV